MYLKRSKPISLRSCRGGNYGDGGGGGSGSGGGSGMAVVAVYLVDYVKKSHFNSDECEILYYAYSAKLF